MLCPFVAVMTLDTISHLFEFVAVKRSDKLVVGYKFLNFTTAVNTLRFFGADNFGFNHFEYLSFIRYLIIPRFWEEVNRQVAQRFGARKVENCAKCRIPVATPVSDRFYYTTKIAACQ